MTDLPRATIHGAGIFETVLAYVAGALEGAAKAELEDREADAAEQQALEDREADAAEQQALIEKRRRDLANARPSRVSQVDPDRLIRALNRDVFKDRQVVKVHRLEVHVADVYIVKLHTCGHMARVVVEDIERVAAPNPMALVVDKILTATCPTCEAALANPVLVKLGEP